MRKLLPVLLALLLTACGFQLRGSQPLPFASLYIATGEGSEMGAALRRMHNLTGKEFITPTEIVIVRDISFSDEQVLAKEYEEGLLYRDMQNDMVQQVMRRLAAAKIEG